MDQATIIKGLDIVAKNDTDIKQTLSIYGYPEYKHQPKGFETLVRTIVNQQLSTKAANSIMARVRDLLPELTAESVLTKRKSSLLKTGLSGRKVEYIQCLAKAITNENFCPDRLEKMHNNLAIKEITKLHGFGEWSAEIYLIFSLRRTDIFPANDLALQIALQELKKLKDRPTPKSARKLTEHWAPWRSVCSLFLWHYYRMSRT